MDIDNLELDLIDYGLEEIVFDREEEVLCIYGNYASFGSIQSELEKRDIEIISSDFERIPTTFKELSIEQKNEVYKFLEICENDEDVQKLSHNMKDL